MRVLVIEDDDNTARLLQMSLEAEFFAVDVALDGEAGFLLALKNQYDLILLDALLPGKSGKDICIDIRNKNITTPILILSALSEVCVKASFLDNGADDYVTKPFSLRELIARIHALLRRPCQMVETTLQFGLLTLDTLRHIALYGNRNIRLTRKEFMLLEYLMRNQGIVLSRMAIMEHVWDIHADPFSNTLEAHIVSLRKKICAVSDEKIIHTVSGCGYVMRV